MEGNGRECRPVVCEGETGLCRSEVGEPWNGGDRTLMFQEAVLSPSFKHLQRGFAGFQEQSG